MPIYGLREIIGPVMVGPSSSHTAGALTIAAMARKLCGKTPARATITLYGSFAHTGVGHGTDKALVAGLLGLEADDLDIRRSFELAKEAGLDVEFIFDTETEADHPNTADLLLASSDGEEIFVRGKSIGGGAAVISRINAVDVNISGERTNVVVSQIDKPGALAHITGTLSGYGINIATANMYRTNRHEKAFTVLETDDEVSSDVRETIALHPLVLDVKVIPPYIAGDTAERIAPSGQAEDEFTRWDFMSGEELLALCETEGVSIAHAFRRREEALCAMRGYAASIDEYLDYVLQVMEAAATEPIEHPVPSTGGLIGGEANLLNTATADGAALLDPLAATAAAYALAVLETNAAMGRIVATPTAGSAGVLPGVLLALAEHRGFNRDQLKEGLLTAAAMGSIIARNASVSGAEGGCQAEVGSAAAMAAGAAVAMAGGAPDRSLAAGANVMMSLMGLVCDPVAGLVEVPCQKRNATAANVALVSAQIALSGVQNLISFDEAVAVMDNVGRSLPFELRESALGGIAAAPSACLYCNARLTC